MASETCITRALTANREHSLYTRHAPAIGTTYRKGVRDGNLPPRRRQSLRLKARPLRGPDVVARPMEPDRSAAGQVTLDFQIPANRLIARHADHRGSGAVPRHATAPLRDVAL